MNQKETAQKVKKGYDQLPYPGIDSDTNPRGRWSWVNLNWIGALVPAVFDDVIPFRRILIAGCGTGNEAFQMQNSFPDAEITAIDYSEQSIEIARTYQKENPRYASIQFEVGDLTKGGAEWARDGHYDFISCHGVMSCIPGAQDAFNTLTKCLAETGTFYLGANGSTHFGISARKSFEYFGYQSDHFEGTLHELQLIELFDRLSPVQNHPIRYVPTYLNSDILSNFSLDLTLSEWVDYAKNAGLHFISSAELIPGLAKTLSPNIFPLLFPKLREEICEVIAINSEVSFHRLIFSKQKPPLIPWDNFDALLECEFQTTRLYAKNEPFSTVYGEVILEAYISPDYKVNFRWQPDLMPVELLRHLESSKKLGEVLADQIKAAKGKEDELVMKIFRFYQLGMIKIFPTLS